MGEAPSMVKHTDLVSKQPIALTVNGPINHIEPSAHLQCFHMH